MEKLFEEKVSVFGAGRTDAGVHALNQVAHFVVSRDPRNYNIKSAFNSLLNKDIVVKKAELVANEFHALRSNTHKTYVYKIWNSEIPTALHKNRSLWIRKPLNLDLLNQSASQLVGEHDFESFRSEGTPVQTTIRSIYSAKFIESGGFIEFHITGNGFLKQMVRNIVGTLLQLDSGQRSIESLPALIKAKDRRLAGPTVAPQGLYLSEVFYPPELDKLAQSL
ncbi:MAG: tRNA pseudouridine(38-40) synthase TruA [Oligoflexia bacterium]|nr:tRNA pseudouridine(38-40) synthase TruA [Oligoflexia bacterium]